jgi:hypothetical protein
MPASSEDARAIVDAIAELRDAILFHAAFTTSPETFKYVQKEDESAFAHGIKTSFRAFRQRQI